MSAEPAPLGHPGEDPATRAAEVRPLSVDPQVLAAIRPMQFHDAPRVAQLHQAAMGNSLWARLGHAFLTQLYQGLVNNERFLAFVYEEPGHPPEQRIRGFIAGSQDTEAMFREVYRTCWFLLAPAALRGVAKNPGVVRQLLKTARYFDASTPESGVAAASEHGRAESLFCSFEPDLRGKRISGAINKVLFDELLARGHRTVKITTETDNVGANRQLRSWGFADRGRFRFYGKEMIVYVLDLEASPRVQAASRHPAV